MAQSKEVHGWVVAKLVELLGVGPESVSADSTLIDDIGADSIDVVELVSEAESHFGISVEEDQIYDLTTVSDVVDLIERLRKSK